MQIQIFTIPVHAENNDLRELNSFLRGNKIVDIEQKLVTNNQNTFWSFCIRYIENANKKSTLPNERKVDYKEILEKDVFEKFSALRECRKQIAAEKAVKVFMVFTDAELAEIAKMPEMIAEKMVGIKGIGDKKVENYGHRLVELYNEKTGEKSKSST